MFPTGINTYNKHTVRPVPSDDQHQLPLQIIQSTYHIDFCGTEVCQPRFQRPRHNWLPPLLLHRASGWYMRACRGEQDVYCRKDRIISVLKYSFHAKFTQFGSCPRTTIKTSISHRLSTKIAALPYCTYDEHIQRSKHDLL